MFFQFRQNNSGGRFEYNEKEGISVIVIIEADSTEEANEKALDLGLYWRGCEKGWDCSCCGDRWSELDGSYDKGHEVPTYYDTAIDLDAAMDSDGFSMKWMEGFEGFVHYANGKIRGFWNGEEKKLVKAKPAKKKAVKKKATKKRGK